MHHRWQMIRKVAADERLQMIVLAAIASFAAWIVTESLRALLD
ncbi:hypothetical protein ABIA45_007847 [Bradyrhizobium sp. USDA 336]